MKNHRCRGFTLVEILVVLGVILVLVAVLFPILSRVRERPRTMQCAGNLRQINLAFRLYLQDNNRYHPPPLVGGQGCSWMDAIYPYVKAESVFGCPSSELYVYRPHCALDATVDGKHFTYNGGYDIALYTKPTQRYVHDSRFLSPSGTILVFDGIGKFKGFQTLPTIEKQDLIDTGMDRAARHNKGFNVLYADGHIKWHNLDSLANKKLWSLSGAD